MQENKEMFSNVLLLKNQCEELIKEKQLLAKTLQKVSKEEKEESFDSLKDQNFTLQKRVEELTKKSRHQEDQKQTIEKLREEVLDWKEYEKILLQEIDHFKTKVQLLQQETEELQKERGSEITFRGRSSAEEKAPSLVVLETISQFKTEMVAEEPKKNLVEKSLKREESEGGLLLDLKSDKNSQQEFSDRETAE